ncbi:hypothetical protein [Streptomyces sp. NPDC001568]
MTLRIPRVVERDHARALPRGGFSPGAEGCAAGRSCTATWRG